MPDNAPTILLTRPMAQSEEFAALLPASVDVVISPVLAIRPIDFSLDIERYGALIFASANGVRAAARCLHLAGAKAVTVGERTARAAKNFGMSVVSARGGADDLIAAVVREKPAGKVLFVRGRYSSGQVADRLNFLGLDTEVVVAYDQMQLSLSGDAVALLQGDGRVILPLFSPRSASLVSAEAVRCKASAPLCLIAMSTEILTAWTGPDVVQKIVARARTADAVADEIIAQVADRA